MTTEEDAAQARREAFYDKQCWCGHAMGNHTMITGECMLCDHATTARRIREHHERVARNIENSLRR